MQTHVRQSGPRRPTASLRSEGKEKTQRSSIHGPSTQCGPSAPPRTRGAISASLKGSPSRPSITPRDSASLEGSGPTLEEADRLHLARGHPSTEKTNHHPFALPPYGGIKCQPLLRSAPARRRQAAIPHSGCDRSPVRQLRSLFRHSGRCGTTV